MFRWLLFACAFLAGPAFADGANLTYLPAPILNSTEQAKANNNLTSNELNVGMTVTAIDSTAIDTPTGIVNVYLDGAMRRLVGTKSVESGVTMWRGSGDGVTLFLGRSAAGVIQGRATLGKKHYVINQIGFASAVAVEYRMTTDVD